jgi:hypothetical protein
MPTSALVAIVGKGGRLQSERMAAFNRIAWPQSSESASDASSRKNPPHAEHAIRSISARWRLGVSTIVSADRPFWWVHFA